MLRAKSMECISLVGMAVGKEKFRDDAKQVSSIMYIELSQITCFLPQALYCILILKSVCFISKDTVLINEFQGFLVSLTICSTSPLFTESKLQTL
jgi:hypothetical protein